MTEGMLSAFILGLVSAGHCAGMCGGIVAAFSLQPRVSQSIFSLQVSYNVGRIVTYAVLGGLAGVLGSATLLLEQVFPIQIGLRILANIMLVALGLYLMGITQLLAPLERGGYAIWRRIQPFTRVWLPADRPHRALALGILWGFLPCGLVYSVLVTALAAGSAWRGVLTMAAFGVGTLPALLGASLFLRRPLHLQQVRVVRAAFGVTVTGLGLLGLMHAMHSGSA